MTDLTNRRPHRVQPHDVEAGDIILGTNTTVYRIAYDGLVGRWYYTTATGRILATSAIDGHLTVWRDTTGRYQDWCAPTGMVRP